MSVRTGYAWAARAAATSARMNSMPEGWLARTDNLGVSTGTVPASGTTDIAGTSVTPFIHSNRLVEIYGTATLTNGSGAGSWALVVVQGGTVVARIGRADFVSGEVKQLSGSVWTDQGSAGSTEFHLAIQYISGSVTCTVANTSPSQARILVEDIGPST